MGVAVAAISASPNTGGGLPGVTQSFVLAYSDSEGVEADLRSARVRFRPSSGSGPECAIDYDAMSDLARIKNDAGGWGPFIALGSGALANSQCTLDLAQSGAVRSGTNLTLTLSLTFDRSFTGVKNIDLRADSNVGATTGWVGRGSWAVLATAATISFDGLAGQVFFSHSESGFTVRSTAVKGRWWISAWESPTPPYVSIDSPIMPGEPGVDGPVDGTVSVTAGGSTFRFSSIDLRGFGHDGAYVFTGLRNGATVFTAQGDIPRAAFVRVQSPSAAAIDTLLIRLFTVRVNGEGASYSLDNIALLEE